MTDATTDTCDLIHVPDTPDPHLMCTGVGDRDVVALSMTGATMTLHVCEHCAKVIEHGNVMTEKEIARRG